MRQKHVIYSEIRKKALDLPKINFNALFYG
jgi:hypothetical protein